MKKRKMFVLGVVLCLFVTTVFTGCAKQYDYDLSEYFTLGKYTGLEYEKSSLAVTDKSINEAIDNVMSSSKSSKEVKEGKVEDGDTVKIDYVGKVDGKTFDGGSANDYELTIGSNSFIEGFETGLIGKKIGEKVSLDLKFPDNYGDGDTSGSRAALAGKAVVFDVTIKSKLVKEKPELTDKWVKENSKYATVADYKKYMKGQLEKNKKIEVGGKLLSELVEKTKIKTYPDIELKLIIQNNKKSVQDQAKQNGVDYSELIKQYGFNSEDEFNKQIEEESKQQEAEEMIAYSIARKEGIEATMSDVDEYYDTMMKDNKMSEADFEKQVGTPLDEYKAEHEADLIKALTVQNVKIFLVDNGKAK